LDRVGNVERRVPEWQARAPMRLPKRTRGKASSSRISTYLVLGVVSTIVAIYFFVRIATGHYALERHVTRRRGPHLVSEEFALLYVSGILGVGFLWMARDLRVERRNSHREKRGA
jgi:hypothetical protein